MLSANALPRRVRLVMQFRYSFQVTQKLGVLGFKLVALAAKTFVCLKEPIFSIRP
jgi:hypothetical protein